MCLNWFISLLRSKIRLPIKLLASIVHIYFCDFFTVHYWMSIINEEIPEVSIFCHLSLNLRSHFAHWIWGRPHTVGGGFNVVWQSKSPDLITWTWVIIRERLAAQTWLNEVWKWGMWGPEATLFKYCINVYTLIYVKDFFFSQIGSYLWHELPSSVVSALDLTAFNRLL